jgi:hypothetical protein
MYITADSGGEEEQKQKRNFMHFLLSGIIGILLLFHTAAFGADLKSLAMAGAPDISPQPEDLAVSEVVQTGKLIRFETKGNRWGVEYRFDPAAGFSSLEGRYNGGKWIPLGKGFQIAVVGVGPAWEVTKSRIEKKTWLGEYRQPKSDLTLSMRINLSGGSLRVWLKTNHGVPLNIAAPVPDKAVDLDIPYLRGYEGSIKYLPDDKLFFSYLVDWTKTNSAIPVPRISYQANLVKKTPPVEDLVAITLSDDIDAVLPSIPNPVSPYRREVADQMVAEFWYGSFDKIGDILDMYHEYGMDKTVAIIHRWQRYGFDTKLPDIFPPDPERGGLETLREVVKRATGYGQRVAVHENYVDVYPEAPSWNEKDLMRISSGEYQTAWANSKHCSPSHMTAHAAKVMPVIKKELKTNACFLDVHSAQAPWFRTDFRDDVPYSAQMKGTRLFTNQLWEYARNIYGGPVFGEGAYHWVHAGCIDSTMAQGEVNERFFPDFVLLKIRPLAINHGMGYYERWCIGYGPKDWMLQVPDPREMDDYRAAEVAYGHAANIGGQANRIVELVAKEYYLVRPLTSRQVNATVVGIRYADDAGWITPSQMILRKPKEVRRVSIQYDNGLTLFVNRGEIPWKVDNETMIGSAGFLARGKNCLAFTNNSNGYWFDYYGGPDQYYLDPRNSDWNQDPLGQRWAKETVRVNDGTRMISQGPIETNTAVSCVREKDRWRLRFFPQGRAGTVRINGNAIGFTIGKAQALDREGKVLDHAGDRVSLKDNLVEIRHCDARVWSYVLLK